ncbi:speckle-type POZ protein B [Nephila pilipes]|uniref:Speckle-type POZ protein B n=1 Tax=Nephila pilipes TaxID=299642 RepID=A0A8X6TEV5_NEPPI|nr:speckle-type POZ protein B [Nephila pilipes]
MGFNIGENANFCCTWVIENFSYCWHRKYEEIMSPAFIADTLKKTKWKMILCPKGTSHEKDDFISFYLERQEDSSGPADFIVYFELSFLAADGSVLVQSKSENSFSKDGIWGCEDFVKREEVFQLRRKDFLPGDVLTAHCKIWNAVSPVTTDRMCIARTCIGVERRLFVWNINQFSCSQNSMCQITSASQENSIMTLKLFPSHGQMNETHIRLEVSCDEEKIKYLTLCMHLLDIFGSKIECLRDEFTFDDEDRNALFTLSFSKEKLMENNYLYLPDDMLTFHCEFAFTTGILSAGIERISYECPPSIQGGIKSVKTLLDSTKILQENLQSFYKENLFCDVQLKTKTGTFPAHKFILSARSPVFKAMFTCNMIEESSQCINIEDLDDDTIQQMLLYLYTAIIEDLDWKSASQLYIAADQYGILSLMSKCSSILKNNISLDNVCELLVLADMHQDQDLKSFVQEFILKHDRGVMISDEWNHLMETNPTLAANTLYLGHKK